MNKSNIQIEVCRVSPAVELAEGRKIVVEMTANEHLAIFPMDEAGAIILSRVECKTLWQVLKKFAVDGSLGSYK